MANVQHSALTDPQIHEPKGAAAASVDTVYVANGAGSGAWQKIEADQIDIADLNTEIQADLDDGTLDITGQWYVTVVMADVSAAGFVLVPVLKTSTFLRARVVLSTGITAADSVLTFTRNGADAQGTLTLVNAASAEGTGFSFTPSGNATVTGPGYIKIASDGASSTTSIGYILLEFEGIVNTP